VRNLTAFGAFVELEEGIDGLVHISDMSWTRRIQHPSEVMKKGDTVEIKILKIDHDNRRISLGYKQLSEDPWPEIARKYAVGTDCLGTITKVLDRGVVVDLDGDLEGFVPVAQLGHKDLEQPANAFDEGESIPLQVIELDKNQRKVVLSVSAYYKKRERTEFEEFLAKHEPKATTMEEAMPEELKAQASEAASETPPDETPQADETPAEATGEEKPAEAAAEVEKTEETPAEPSTEASEASEETVPSSDSEEEPPKTE
jgi:small subunit ribosomal protein S1